MNNTRITLIRKALELFTQKGISGVQAKEIAAAAGAVPNAITYHFGGLAGLIDAVWEYALSNFDCSELEQYCKENHHLLNSSDGKRQYVTEIIGILFQILSSKSDSALVNRFLMTTSVTQEGRDKIKKNISTGLIQNLMQIYLDITGDKDSESAFAWVLTLAGGAVIYSVNADLYENVFPDGKLPVSIYGRIQYITVRNALFSLGLMP